MNQNLSLVFPSRNSHMDLLLRCQVVPIILVGLVSASALAEDDDDAKPSVPTAHPSATSPATADADGDSKKDVDASPDRVVLTPEVIAHYHVATAPAQRRAVSPPIVAAAEVGFNADTVMDIGTLVTGRVQEVRVHVGDTVAAGDVLVIIDSQELGQAQNAYLEREGIRVAAENDATLAQTTWTRSQPLIKDQAISSGEASRRENDMHKAQAALQASEVALAGAENAMRLFGMDDAGITELKQNHRVSSRVAIRAPAAGAVIARSVTLGEIARPDQEALVVIADLAQVWVTASVPVSSVHQVAVGQSARITAAGIPQPIEAQVTFVPPALDAQSHTLPVRLTVPWNSGLRPGMFATVSIDATDAQAPLMIAVPSDAVFSQGGGRVVFVPVTGGPGSFRACRVVTGPPEGDLTPIISGIANGDQVVITGGFIIKAQMAKGPADED